MAEDKFRLPGSSYDQLTKIIKAYNLMRGPVGPAEVARPLGVDPTIVSRNNAFLVGIGLVEGGNKKALTGLGSDLAHALEHDVEEDVRRYWRHTVVETEFLRQLVASVRIRNGMEGGALLSHVAYSARQPSSGPAKTGAATVIEILKAAGALEERDGKFVAGSLEDAPVGPPAEDREEAEPPTDDGRSAGVVTHMADRGLMTSEEIRLLPSGVGGMSVRINVNVECSVDELPLLAERLVQLRETLAEPPKTPPDTE